MIISAYTYWCFFRLANWRPINAVNFTVQTASIAEVITGAISTPKWCYASTTIDAFFYIYLWNSSVVSRFHPVSILSVILVLSVPIVDTQTAGRWESRIFITWSGSWCPYVWRLDCKLDTLAPLTNEGELVVVG